MKAYYNKTSFLLTGLFILGTLLAHSQDKGSLFIIGGGDRSPALVKQMVETARLRPSDYIVVLPMATSIPEESVAYISGQLSGACSNKITSFNFTRAQADNQQTWLDSVKNARLIFITGGDQNKFMAVVKDTKLYEALHQAFKAGATISGTSAGAAVMSQIMITGEERGKTDSDGFKEIKPNMVVTAQGMGFLTTAIVDQHFIKRSRYNRLFSALADHPDKIMIGIDESTAIIVTGKKATVAGESQVVVVRRPQKLKTTDNKKTIFKDAKISLYASGESFQL